MGDKNGVQTLYTDKGHVVKINKPTSVSPNDKDIHVEPHEKETEKKHSGEKRERPNKLSLQKVSTKSPDQVVNLTEKTNGNQDKNDVPQLQNKVIT